MLDFDSCELNPVDHVTTLWTNKTGHQGGLGGKRSRCLWMSEGPMPLQLDPLDNPLTLRVRRRPSGPAPVGPQGQRVLTGVQAAHISLPGNELRPLMTCIWPKHQITF